jgi:small-conductance mechanosensitive channel
MKRKPALYFLFILAALIFMLVLACSAEDTTGELTPTGLPLPISEERAPASAPPPATEEPTPASPPEEEQATEALGEAVAERTPVPTPGPGPVNQVVAEITASAGVSEKTILGLAVADWINLGISVLAILAGYTVGNWLIRSLLRRIVRRTPTDFDDQFLEAIKPHLRWLVAIFSFQIATLRLDFLSSGLRRFLQDVYFVLYLAVFFSILWKLVDFGFEWYTEHLETDVDADKLDAVTILAKRVVQIVLIVLFATVLLSLFGISIGVAAAALGLGGLAISLAAQDTLADTISGFVILIDRPFRIGDRIEISGLGTWGDVIEIGTRTTRIRTRDNRMVIVPNSTIGKSQVVNYTYPDPRYRVQMDIGIGYGMDVEKTRRIIIDTVSQVEGVLKDRPVDALYNEMGESAMTFRVRWWIESYEDTRRVYDRVNTALQAALDEASIKMPIPTHVMDFKISPENADRLSQAFREPS